MEVKTNKDLTIRVGHKTRLGKADEVFKHGNWLREQKGLRPYDNIQKVIKKRSFLGIYSCNPNIKGEQRG